MRLLFIGFGAVGQGLAKILRDQATLLQENHGFAAHIVGVATQHRGTLYTPAGLDINTLLEAITAGHLDHYPDTDGLQRNRPVEDLIRESEADVMVELSHSDFQTGEPALTYCRVALTSGKHIVLANKGPVALAYAELVSIAQRVNRRIGFEATVMAGTPSLRLGLDALAGCRIIRVRGILNGTTNYMLAQMENGMPYHEALRQAQQLGYAEADPTADVEGWDTASKAVILSNILFQRAYHSLDAIPVEGITRISPDAVAAAQAAGERWKLIATVSAEAAQVAPLRLPLSDPLANVSGTTNAITYTTDLLGEVTLVGPGAGGIETGFGILADLLAIARL